MRLMKFFEVNKKRLIGTSLLLSLLLAQSVGASGTISDGIKSRGNIDYDDNFDGESDVLFYSEDLKTVANGIDNLNTNVATLQQAFTDLGDQTAEYKTQIISGLNSNVYAKANIDATATFEQIIDKINNIPAPTVAQGAYYSNGDNSGLGVGISPSSVAADVDIDGVTDLNLAVNESITLPSGYYPNDITIKNNVANRGSAPIILTSGMRHFSLAEGYYSNIEVTTDISNLSNGEITYFIGHKHTGNSTGGGCYTEVISSYLATHSHNWKGTGHYSGTAEYFECTHCGRGLYPQFNDWNFPNVPCSTYTVYVYGPGCGYEEGEIVRTTTNYAELNSLTANELLSKVEIVY